MIGHFAFCVRSTVARCHAQSVNAWFWCWTIRVGSTAHGHWFCRWKVILSSVFMFNQLFFKSCKISKFDHLRGWQWTLGSPVYPAGHLQTDLWFSTWHKAPLLQGSPTTQGFTQSWLTQLLSPGQSSSREHSGGGGSTGIFGTTNYQKILQLSWPNTQTLRIFSHNWKLLTDRTFNVRISDVARRARTQSSVVLRQTLGVDAAEVHLAGFQTTSSDTFVSVWAVRINATFRFCVHCK